ncbi:MAG: acyl-CoA dehydrogenase family protein [Caulobacteraceae bacterium]
MLRAQQDEADERGWYTEEIHQALKDGGFYRIVQPRMFGGYEFDPVTLVKVVIEIARGHPSSGWCYCLGTSHAMIAGSHFDAETQAELFGPEGDFRAPHRAAPAGKFERVEGGYRVNGTWPYASGAPICTHFMAGSLIHEEGKRPRNIDFIVPRAEIEIIPDWGGDRSFGMRGSGSQSVKLVDVFVPDNTSCRRCCWPCRRGPTARRRGPARQPHVPGRAGRGLSRHLHRHPDRHGLRRHRRIRGHPAPQGHHGRPAEDP